MHGAGCLKAVLFFEVPYKPTEHMMQSDHVGAFWPPSYSFVYLISDCVERKVLWPEVVDVRKVR